MKMFCVVGGSRGGDWGSGPPLKNHKNIGFHSNTGPHLLKSTRLPIQHSMLGHFNGVSLVGRWWPAYCGI